MLAAPSSAEEMNPARSFGAKQAVESQRSSKDIDVLSGVQTFSGGTEVCSHSIIPVHKLGIKSVFLFEMIVLTEIKSNAATGARAIDTQIETILEENVHNMINKRSREKVFYEESDLIPAPVARKDGVPRKASDALDENEDYSNLGTRLNRKLPPKRTKTSLLGNLDLPDPSLVTPHHDATREARRESAGEDPGTESAMIMEEAPPYLDTEPQYPNGHGDSFEAGELVWCKLGSYPFWPAMVIVEPRSGLHEQQHGGSKEVHVMYFGDQKHHGWIDANSRTMPYEGLKEFHRMVEMKLGVGDKKNRGRSAQFFDVRIKKASLRKRWELARKEADKALKMSSVERLDNISINFVYPKSVRKLALLVNPKAQFEELPGRKNLQVNSNGFREYLTIQRPDLDLNREPYSGALKPRRRSTQLESVAFTEEHAESLTEAGSSSDESKPWKNPKKITKLEFGEIFAAICSTCTEVREAELVQCDCGNRFHRQCAQSTVCEQCQLDTCFICGNLHVDEKPLKAKCCRRLYHVSCLRDASLHFSFHANSDIIEKCPRHFCVHCNSQRKYNHKENSQIVTCIKCPATYHKQELCMPAAAQFVTASQIICPRHTRQPERKINVDWCLICGESGELFCCDICPGSFHSSCLRKDSGTLSKQDSFLCPECQDWLFLVYGKVCWVKFSSYRWWPAKVVHPSQVPERVLRSSPISHGAFYVYFFGTHEYARVRSTDAYALCEEDCDQKKKTGNQRKLHGKYITALQEAKEASVDFETRRNLLHSRAKPPKYRHITVNKVVSPSCKVTNEERFSNEGNICICPKKNPCVDETCVNRSTYIECSAQCPNGEKCCNRRFTRRQHKKTIIFLTANGVGWGLKTAEPIDEGDFVIEYVGELIDQDEYEKRIQRLNDQSDHNVYFMVAGKRIIDAGPSGNNARFINHSCDPNLRTESWEVNGVICIGLFAIRKISTGEELTFDYNMITKGTLDIACMCKSSNCKGSLSKIDSKNRLRTEGKCKKQNGSRN